MKKLLWLGLGLIAGSWGVAAESLVEAGATMRVRPVN